MKHSSNLKTILSFLCGLVILAACTPAAVPTSAAPETAAVTTIAASPTPVIPTTAAATMVASTTVTPTAAVSDTQAFADPFAFCAGVGTIDQPDARYTGPKTPDPVVKGLMKASGAAADIPLEVFSRGTFWRCMDKHVYACFVGANLPCESKANTSQEPTAAMNDFCKANPTSDFIPAAVTGHDTIYQWTCKDGKASSGKQVFQVDTQGYIKEIWYPIAP